MSEHTKRDGYAAAIAASFIGNSIWVDPAAYQSRPLPQGWEKLSPRERWARSVFDLAEALEAESERR